MSQRKKNGRCRAETLRTPANMALVARSVCKFTEKCEWTATENGMGSAVLHRKLWEMFTVVCLKLDKIEKARCVWEV